MKKIIYLALSAGLLISCNQSQETIPKNELKENATHKSKVAYESEAAEERSDGGIAMAPGAPLDAEIQSRKLIWTANLQFEVKNVDKSSSKIRNLCDKNGAYISDMNRTANDYEINNEIIIRVSNENFHSLVEKIKGESIKMRVASINSNDITEEFVDLESRLKTKREARERYIQILRNKTGSIEDVIAAEEAIRRITEEIESKEGRLRYLQNQVDFSTISLVLTQKIPRHLVASSDSEISFGDRAQSAFGSGWNFIKKLTLGLIAIWPLILIFGTLIYFKRNWIRSLFKS